MRKEREPAPSIDPRTPSVESWFYADDPTGHVASIYFDSASSALDIDDRAVLAQVSLLLQDANPPTMLTVEGYADSIGTEESNLKLSTQRAETVKNFLLPDVSTRTAVKMIGFGEKGPKSTGNNANELRHYRRVDVIMAPPRKTTPHVPPKDTDTRDRSAKLKRAIEEALEALDATAVALTAGVPDAETIAAFERYFPLSRYQSPEFMRILAAEIDHLRDHIASVQYDEFNPRHQATEGRIQSVCDPESPQHDNELCAAVTGATASAFPRDNPDRIVLSPAWYALPPFVPGSLLVHESTHLLLGLRGHPTEISHRNPYAIQGLVAKLGGLAAELSDEIYPQPKP